MQWKELQAHIPTLVLPIFHQHKPGHFTGTNQDTSLAQTRTLHWHKPGHFTGTNHDTSLAQTRTFHWHKPEHFTGTNQDHSPAQTRTFHQNKPRPFTGTNQDTSPAQTRTLHQHKPGHFTSTNQGSAVHGWDRGRLDALESGHTCTRDSFRPSQSGHIRVIVCCLTSQQRPGTNTNCL